MKKSWVLYIASRFLFKGRGSSPVLSILGIAFGVLALIVIIAVMNGFQLGFIESILEISSYHLRLEKIEKDRIDEAQKRILTVAGVRAAVPFKEFQALARGKRTGQQAVLIRGLNEKTPELDGLMNEKLDFISGEFDLTEGRSVLMGSELSRRLGVSLGDKVTIFSITGILSTDEEESGVEEFTIKGIFRTGYYEYDSTWAFINIDNVSYLDKDSEVIIGIKLANRFNDRIALELTKKSFSDFENIKITSWRDYNRSFFGALRTEKLFMFILVGIIFIVVGLNIFQSQRRAVLQRREEIGLLRAVGGAQNDVRFVFVIDGAITGLSGAAAGLVFGLLIAYNIPGFFSIIETIVNTFINLLNIIAGIFDLGWAKNFAVFSPAVFYIKEIPSRILPFEVILIFMFGFLSALAASYFASGKISKIQPAEVLRYE